MQQWSAYCNLEIVITPQTWFFSIFFSILLLAYGYVYLWISEYGIKLILSIQLTKHSIVLFLVLSTLWYEAIVNSEEELHTLANLVKRNTCQGLASIGGFTNLDQFTQFAFSDGYIPNNSGKSCKATTEVYF